ncbi:hypothetical protein HOD08_03660 [bacterium]|nr:hypothetical protein [bacterium]
MEKNEELVQHRFVEAAAEGNVLSRAVRSVLIRFFEGVKSIFSWLKPKSKEEDVKRSRTTGFEEKERVFGDGLRELKKSIVDAVIKGCDYVLALYKKVGKEPVAVKVGVSGSAKVPSDSEYKPAKAKLPPTPGASKKAPPPPPKGLPPLPGAGPNKKVKKLSPPKMPAGLKKPPPPPPPSLPSLPPLPPMPS